MNRNQKKIYCFIYDDNKRFYRADHLTNGDWNVYKSSEIYPIKNNPSNLVDTSVEFATNKFYFSMNRSITEPLEFILDGAAILNSVYLKGKGINESLYFAIFEFDSSDGKYKLSYNGKFDFQQKVRDEKLSTFTVPVVDDSAWGMLSQNDDVIYSFDCSETNPDCVKVLIDDFTLKNRFVYQTVNVPLTGNGYPSFLSAWQIMPVALANQDGDSYGIISKSQQQQYISNSNPLGDIKNSSTTNCLFESQYAINNVQIKGSLDITSQANGGIMVFLATSKMNSVSDWIRLFPNNPPYSSQLTVENGGRYNNEFSITRNLDVSERVFIILYAVLQYNGQQGTITPITTNITFDVITKAPSTIVYGLRPLDLLKGIVKKATLGNHSASSLFFEENNKTILVPGESIRGVKDAKLYTSFKDFFESFSALFFMALKISNGSLFMELADSIYSGDGDAIDIGDIIECSISPAVEYFANEISVGSVNQDYRRPSGRLEFNSVNTYSLPFKDVKNSLSLVSKYRTDCYGIIFMILDDVAKSSKDNLGDKSVFIIDITDDLGSSLDPVETFENITVNNTPLAPIIKFPLNGETINNNKPLLRGVGIPGNNVSVYIYDVLDGSTTIDSNGNWSYQISTSLPSYNPPTFDGISIIRATYTDLLASYDEIQLLIDTTISAPTLISYPRPNDSLYNNTPLIKGIAPPSTNIDIYLNGVIVASVVANNSCRWEYKMTSPIPNGTNVLSIGVHSVTFNVNSFVEFPLITFCGSELDGFPIINNMPLIRGVAKPGTQVNLWIDYISYNSIGSAIADANGNWSYQTVPTTYNDPTSGLPINLVPMKNGLNIVSTSLTNNVVYINVSGYKLNRPNYSPILGVIDNTVFNTRLSPARMMRNHNSMLSAIMNMQRNAPISFEKPGKNSNLFTVLGSDVVQESADIYPSSLGSPLAILEYANIKTVAKRRFADILYAFNQGLNIKASFRGNTIFLLPIGGMKMNSIIDSVQEWKLLISPKTSYNQLLNLYKNGLTINLMQNSLFHSDYNTIHFVEYDFTQSQKYNFKEIYDDLFSERNDAWVSNPRYTQKLQRTDQLKDQIVNNGLSAITLRIYRCSDASLVDTISYEPVTPSPIPLPEVVMQASVDLSLYPEDKYFFVIFVEETPVSISERIETRDKWSKTILIESSNSVNSPGVFYVSGFKTIVRVEGIVKKIQPELDVTSSKSENGDVSQIYSMLSKRRMIRFGTAYGLPDYMSIKVSAAISNDQCFIEGVHYSMIDGEKITQSEDIDGHPMYYYDVNMAIKDNYKGKVFAGEPGADRSGVIVVVDASAIGLPAHSLINIEED